MITASTATLSPGLTLIFSITPSRSARKIFSIFIASTTASVYFFFFYVTSSTEIYTTRPGIGQRMDFSLSDSVFAGINRA